MEHSPFTTRPPLLEQVARSRFGVLTPAEQKLVCAATGPGFAYCGSANQDDDPSNEPDKASQWGQQRSIRAALIRWLCVERSARDHVDPSGIQVHGARIEGKLDLAYVEVPFPLVLWQCALTNGADFHSFDVGHLSLAGSWVHVVNAQGLRVKSDVLLNNGFHAVGEVRLAGAQIGGNLDCSSGKFINPIQRDHRMSDQSDRAGMALNAFNILVKGSILLNNGFHSEGEVVLLDAHIGGSVYCDNGEYINPAANNSEDSGKALTIRRGNIAGNVYLTAGFRAEGTVRLTGAHIAGALDLRGGRFEKANLLLDESSAASFYDDRNSWPQSGHLSLNGFVYELMEPRDVNLRLEWLNLQDMRTFYPQPYLQLSKVLAAAGDDEGKRQVLIAMRDREPPPGNVDTLLHWLFKGTIGYGYRPLLACWEILAASALGWIVYRRSYLAGTMVPTDKEAYEALEAGQGLPNHYRRFAPFIYSLENTLPLVKLGQSEKWQPAPKAAGGNPSESTVGISASIGGSARWPWSLDWIRRLLIHAGLLRTEEVGRQPSRLSRRGTSARFIRVFLWLQILLGWILATLFLAGISGIVRKE